MDPNHLTQLIVIILLLLLSAFFSSAETALTTVNHIRIRALIEGGNKRAQIVKEITENPGKMLSAILVGNNIVNIAASAMATAFTINIIGNRAVGIATGVLTLLVLIFGEVAPKQIATARAEKLALAYAPAIHILMVIMTPVIFLVNSCSKLIIRLFGIKSLQQNISVTEEELLTMVDVSHEEGIIENDEHEIFHNVIDFGDTVAKDVMVPRVRMTVIDINSTYEEVLAIYREALFTRFPVYEDTADRIIGILNMKDMILCDDPESFSIRDVLREPFFTYENKNTSELLVEMRQRSYNIAIVLDEYGELAGMLTLEDLLEEIVGEIHDEYDKEDDENIRELGDNCYKIEGSTNLEEINDKLGLSLSSEDYDSLGGYFMEQLDSLPALGDKVTLPEGIMEVIEMDDRRIAYVKFTKNISE